jgi:hypothetical protein
MRRGGVCPARIQFIGALEEEALRRCAVSEQTLASVPADAVGKSQGFVENRLC